MKRLQDLPAEANDGLDVVFAQGVAKFWHSLAAVDDDLALFIVGESFLDLLQVEADPPTAIASMAFGAAEVEYLEALDDLLVSIVG